MMSSPDDGMHHEDRDTILSAVSLPIAGYHITNYHGSQASVPLNAHHETGGIDRSLIVLDHGCSQSLTYPLRNVHDDLHHASTMAHAHGGAQDSAGGIQYPAGCDQMSSANKHDVNKDNDPRLLVMQSLVSTPMQYGSQAPVDMHGRYAHNIPVHDSSMSMQDGSQDPADGYTGGSL